MVLAGKPSVLRKLYFYKTKETMRFSFHFIFIALLAGTVLLQGCTKTADPSLADKTAGKKQKPAKKNEVPPPVISDLPQSDSLDQRFSRSMNVESGSLDGKLPDGADIEDTRTAQQKSSAMLEAALAREENASPESLKQAEEARKKAQLALDKANEQERKQSQAYRDELEHAMNDAERMGLAGEGSDSFRAPLEESGNVITELGIIYFDFDRSALRDEVKQDIKKNFEWIQTHPEVQIQLEGHCDERGSNEYNLALGEQRTRAVYEYLLSLGANPERFTSVSFGEERPAALGHTAEAWSKNRRVEFTRF